MGKLFLKTVSDHKTAQKVDSAKEGIPKDQGHFVAISEVQNT